MTGAPQDHYLLAWAVCCGGGNWHSWEAPWPIGPFEEAYGQFNFGGAVYLTRLSRMGVPIVTAELREAILEQITEARMGRPSLESADAR